MQELGVGRWVVLVLLAYGCGDGSGESFDAGVDRGVREAGRPDAMLRDSEPPPELSCDLVGETLDEDWGPSESTGRTVACFDVRSDSDEEREEQVAYSSVPVAEGFGLVTSDRLVVIGADNRRVPAQFEVLARWGGPIADESRAIRWLGVSVPVKIDAGASHAYAILQQEDAPAQVRVAGDLSVEAGEGGLVINTGAALFTLAAAEPGLLRSVDLTGADGSTLRAYDSAIGDGSGPRLVLETGSGSTAIDSSASSGGEVVPDEGAELSLIASGPVRVVVAQSGHFVAADGVSRCEADPAAYEALGYTLLLTFSRGSSHVDVEFHFRNECSDLSFGPWTDQAARVRSLSLEFPLSLSAERNVFAAGSAELSSMASPSAEVAVEQRSGAYAGADWTRRARVRVGSASIEMGEEFSRPFAGVSDGVVGAYAFVPWMRFREPQAVAVGADRLSLRFVSESVVVGEARGIWNHARVGFGRSLELSDMQSHRAAAVSGLERSLLVHPTRTTLNGARVFPSVGDDSPSALREPPPLRRWFLGRAPSSSG